MKLDLQIRKKLMRNLFSHARKRKNEGMIEYSVSYLNSLPDAEFCFLLAFLEEFYNGRALTGKFMFLEPRESYSLNNKRNRDIFCHMFFERLEDIEKQES